MFSDLEKCIICIEQCFDGISTFTVIGQTNIVEILEKHFSFIIMEPRDIERQICSDCWNKTLSFHTFFQMAENAHKNLYQLTINSHCDDDLTFGPIKVEPIEPPEAGCSMAQMKLESGTGEIDLPIHESTTHFKDDDDFFNNDDFYESANNDFDWAEPNSEEEYNSEKECNSDESINCTTEIFASPVEHKIPTAKSKSTGKKREKKIANITCDICPKTFVTSGGLRYHMKVKHAQVKDELLREDGNTEIDSSTSDKIPKKSAGVRKKKSEQLDDIDIKPKRSHMCDICARVFNSKPSFLRHLETHRNIQEDRAQCDICSKWFRGKYYVDRHIKRMHVDQEDPVKCPHCDKIKPNTKSLKRHIYECHREPSHKCTLCDKSFIYSTFLREHMATHTGESLYTCWYCPFPFKNKSNFYKHMKRRHLEQYTIDRAKKALKEAE